MSTADAQTCVALIVRNPFDDYKRGDLIRNAKIIRTILNSEQARHVNKILLPITPAIEPAQEAQEKPADLEPTVKPLSNKTLKKSKE